MIDRAVAGEEVLVIWAGKAIAHDRNSRYGPVSRASRQRVASGFLRGRYKVPEDIKTAFKEEIEAMLSGDPDKLNR